MSDSGKNTDLQYAAVLAPAARFQARRLLVVTDGGWWWMVDGVFQKVSLILLKILLDEIYST